MIINQLFGIGGYCEDCSPTHDHPLHNIIEETVIEEETAS